jgi:23S rRNA (uracil1939-C5)-methyltransferase
VDVQVTKKRKSYFEGYPIHYHHYSDNRKKPFCEHFGLCGGCKWQPLPYNLQLSYKQREVYNNLLRIGKIELPEIESILASPREQFYRNKLEFTFSNKRWLTTEELEVGKDKLNTNGLGFHIPNMFDKVVDIQKCHLQDDPSNLIRLEIKKFALENSYSFFDLREQQGLLRTLLIRTASTGEVMVIIVFFYEDEKARNNLFNHLIKLFPQVTSWMYIINSKRNDSITDQEAVLFHGCSYIIEEIENLKFKIGPKSFFQTNSFQAVNLYRVIWEFAALTGNETVYDLYTGTGTIAIFLASQSKKVVGIEYVQEAVNDAIENSKLNNINNTFFLHGDMKNLLNLELFEKHGNPDVLITDPPRAGMHADVVQAIMNVSPERIVYVSCNSATQARDLQILDKQYKVVKIQPVDMFPHTHHVENVALLNKK